VSWREAPKPGGRRFRGRESRRAGYRMALGIWLGMLAFLLGRRGPTARSADEGRGRQRDLTDSRLAITDSNRAS
jgi:hypothetical protein